MLRISGSCPVELDEYAMHRWGEMFNGEVIGRLVRFVADKDGIADKSRLAAEVQQAFGLTKDRSVYDCEWFAIRFCTAASATFSNTVLALSKLRQNDKVPFFVCIVTPTRNYLLLANSTFLKKISHSSQALRCDNIKGSFNGSDILREFNGVRNSPENFEYLFASHENFTFEENLERLVEATNNIAPKGQKFSPTDAQRRCILESVDRAVSFACSTDFVALNSDLHARVRAVQTEIAIAALIENVNLRGRIIEYLITAEDNLKETVMRCLRKGEPLPKVFTADALGDYDRDFPRYRTKTDIKTKILFLSSNPKGYNIDKLLSFLAENESVYLIYIVAISQDGEISMRLCSVFCRQLLSGTRIIAHWAGRNSRGVTQFDGKALEAVVEDSDPAIDPQAAREFLLRCLEI